MKPKVIYITGDISTERERVLMTSAELVLNRHGFVVLNASRLPLGLPIKQRVKLGKACIDVSDAVLFTASAPESDAARAEDQYCAETFTATVHAVDGDNIIEAVSMIEEVLA